MRIRNESDVLKVISGAQLYTDHMLLSLKGGAVKEASDTTLLDVSL